MSKVSKNKNKSIRTRVDKAALRITKAVGARNLAKYAGESIARRKNKNVKRTVTKKQAAKSGAALAANVGSLAAGGAAAGIVRGAQKARKAKSAATAAKKGIKIAGQKKPMKFRHHRVTKGKGVVHGGRGSAVGRSGTSYKPRRK